MTASPPARHGGGARRRVWSACAGLASPEWWGDAPGAGRRQVGASRCGGGAPGGRSWSWRPPAWRWPPAAHRRPRPGPGPPGRSGAVVATDPDSSPDSDPVRRRRGPAPARPTVQGGLDAFYRVPTTLTRRRPGSIIRSERDPVSPASCRRGRPPTGSSTTPSRSPGPTSPCPGWSWSPAGTRRAGGFPIVSWAHGTTGPGRPVRPVPRAAQLDLLSHCRCSRPG